MRWVQRTLRLWSLTLAAFLLLSAAVPLPGLETFRPPVALAAPQIAVTVDPLEVTEPGYVTITLTSDQPLDRVLVTMARLNSSELHTVTNMAPATDNTEWTGTYYVADGAADGTYEVTAEGWTTDATDNYGRASAEFTVSLGGGNDDTDPPTLALKVPSAAQPGDYVSIRLSSSEPLQSATATIYGPDSEPVQVELLGSSGGYEWQGSYYVPADSPEKPYTVEGVGVDQAGNSASVQKAFLVDATPPDLTVVATPNPVLVDSEVTITVEGSEPLSDDGPSVTILRAGSSERDYVTMYDVYGTGKTWRGSYPVTAEATFDVIVVGADIAGNVTRTEISFSSEPRPDNTPPTLAITVQPEAVQPGDEVTITVTANEDLQYDPHVEVAHSQWTEEVGVSWAGPRTWTGTVEVPLGINDGQVTVTAEGVDPAGNWGTAENQFVVDTRQPGLLIQSTPDLARAGTRVTIVVLADEDLAQEPEVLVGPVDQPGAAMRVWMTGSDQEWSGSFTVSDTSPNGPYTVIANGVDAAGNEGSAEGGSFTVDTIPPVMTATVSPTLVGGGDTVSITITSDEALDGDPWVTVSGPDGTAAVSNIRPTTGGWTGSFYIDPSAPSGSYVVSASGGDAAGNPSTATAEFYVDTEPSLFTLDVSPRYVQPGGTVSIEVESSEPLSILESTVEPEGGPKTDISLSLVDTNTWASSYKVAAGAAEGPYTVAVEGQDEAGNWSSEEDQFIVDGTPPTLTVDVTHNAARPGEEVVIRPGGTVTITVESSEPLGAAPHVSVARLSGGVQEVAMEGTLGENRWVGTYTVDPTAADGAVYIVRAAGSDLAGNQVDLPQGATFSVDAVAPTLTVTAAPSPARSEVTITVESSEDLADGDPRVTVIPVDTGDSGEPPEPQRVNVFPDDTEAQTWVGTFTVQMDTPDGLYAVEATGKDLAGNETAGSTELTVDTTPPTLTLEVMPDRPRLGNRVAVRIVSNEPLQQALARYRREAMPPDVEQGEWEELRGWEPTDETEQAEWRGYFWVATNDPDGTPYTIQGQAIDQAGNTQPWEASITVDGSAPTLSEVTVGSSSTAATITFWVDDQISEVVVEYGTSTSYGSTATLTHYDTDFERRYTASLTDLTPDTQYHYRVTATNPIGNESWYRGEFVTWPEDSDKVLPPISPPPRREEDNWWEDDWDDDNWDDDDDGGRWDGGWDDWDDDWDDTGSGADSDPDPAESEPPPAPAEEPGDEADSQNGSGSDVATGPATGGSTEGGFNRPALGGNTPDGGREVAVVRVPAFQASDSTEAGVLDAMGSGTSPQAAGVVSLDPETLNRALSSAVGSQPSAALLRVAAEAVGMEPTQILLVPPDGLAEMVRSGSELAFDAAAGSVVLSPEALAELQVGAGERGWLVVALEEVSTSPALPAAASLPPHTHVRAVSSVVEPRIGIVGAGGRFAPFRRLGGPLTVALAYDPYTTANPELVGLYQQAPGSPGTLGGWRYLGSTPAPEGQSIAAKAQELGRYVLLEYRQEYTDVPPDHWAHGVIQAMAARQVIRGTGSGEFDPDRPVTRAEFATMLARALDLEAAPQVGSRFLDVSVADWYAGPLGAAVGAGLFRGDGDGRIRPDTVITRQEMAVILSRALRLKEKVLDLNTGGGIVALSFLADAGDIASWAQEGVAATLGTGLMQGRGGGRFAPQEVATRAETAAVLKRLMEWRPGR